MTHNSDDAPVEAVSPAAEAIEHSTAVIVLWKCLYAGVAILAGWLIQSHYGWWALGKVGIFTGISALIGYGTNVVALKMLFHPREPIGHPAVWPSIPKGLVLKNKPALAEKIAAVAKSDFLTSEKIRAHVPEEKMIKMLKPKIETFIQGAMGDRDATFSQFFEKFGGVAGGGITLDKVSGKLSDEALEVLRKRIGSGQFAEETEKAVRQRVADLCRRPLREFVTVADRGSLADAAASRLRRAVDDGRIGSLLSETVRTALSNLTEQDLEFAKNSLGKKVGEKLPDWITAGAAELERYLAKPQTAAPIKAILAQKMKQHIVDFLKEIPLGRTVGSFGLIGDVERLTRGIVDDNWSGWLSTVEREIVARKQAIAREIGPGITGEINGPWLEEFGPADRGRLAGAVGDVAAGALTRWLDSGAMAKAAAALLDDWCGRSLGELIGKAEDRIVAMACEEIALLAEAACLPESTMYRQLNAFVRGEVDAMLRSDDLQTPLKHVSPKEINDVCASLTRQVVSVGLGELDSILEELKLDEMIRNVILEYRDDDLEELVNRTSEEEMRKIERVGLYAGGIAGGGVQLLFTMLGL